jgi:hypothetical protein
MILKKNFGPPNASIAACGDGLALWQTPNYDTFGMGPVDTTECRQ